MLNSRPRRSLLVALVVFLLAAAATASLIWRLNDAYLLEVRGHALGIADDHADALERSIDRALSANYALSALVRQGNGAIGDFDAVAEGLLPFYPGAASMQLAPGGVVRRIFPLEGNERALGLDLLRDPVRGPGSIRARDTGKLVLFGPFDLVRGGVGAAGWLPVFLSNARGEPAFWGFTSVLIRFPDILETAEFPDLTRRGFDYELWHKDPATGQKVTIAASSPSALVEPVDYDLHLPDAIWTLSVAPVGGWSDPTRLALAAGLGLLFSLLLAYAAKLMVESKEQEKRLESRVAERTAEVRASDSRYRELFEANPQPMWVYDLDTLMFLAVNDAALAHYGYSREEFLAMTILDIRPAEEVARLMQRVADVRDADVRDAGVWRHRKKDGALIEVEVTAHTLEFSGRRAQIVHVSDVTDRLRVERKLSASEDRFRKAFFVSPDSVNINRLEDGLYVSINRGFTLIMGYTEDDVIGRTSAELNIWVDPEDRARLIRGLKNDGMVSNLEANFRAKDGHIVHGLMSAAVIDIEGAAHLVSVTRDVTERRRDERLLRLEHAVATRTAAAGDASAAIKEILRAICESEGWGFGVHWYVDVAAGVLRFSEFWSIADPGLERYAEATRQVVFAPGIGMVGHVFQSGQPLWVPDTTADTRVVQGILLETGLRSLFAFPLVASGTVTGVLAFLSREAREPDARLFAAAQVLGSQIGQFLQRRQREEDLQRFSAAMDASADGIYVVDRTNLRFLHVNASACTMLGMTREEILALGPEGVLAVPREELARIYDEVIAGRLTEPVELLRQRTDGRTVWVEIRRRAQEAGAGWTIVTVARDITERKLNENALRESEARFRSLTEMFLDFYWETDAEHRFTLRSGGEGGSSSLALLAHESPIGKRRWDLPYLAPGAAEWQAHRETLDAHRPFRNFEIARPGVDGGELHYSISGDPVFDDSGAFLGYRGVGSNVTERKRAEANLRLAASVFEHTQEGIIITDADASIVSVNRRFTEITGYAAEEVIGRNPRMLKSDRQGSDFYRAMWAFINTHGYWTGELWNRHKDGRAYPEWLSISTVRDERGEVGNYVAVFTDISQRIAAEQTLRESERVYRTTFESAPESVWLLGPDRRTREVNQRLCDLLGYAREEMLGRDRLEFVDEENAAIFLAHARRAPGRKTRTYEVSLRHRDGRNIPTEFHAVDLLNDDGSLMGVLAFVVDLTERKHHEEELLRLNEQLEQRVVERTQALEVANRELEAFSYSVSHDLRAPLRAIQGFSRLVETQYAGQIDDQGRDMLRRVGAGAQKMGVLIDDLLNLSRISRQVMRVRLVDLSALARELADELHAGEPQRGVEWVIAPQVSAEGDPGLFRVMLQNLIGNAWKYSSRRDDARIEFGVAEIDGRTAYFVRDNGAGFDMAYANKLFGAFQRLHSNSEFPGTGIGLATVARILHRHGGRVWADGRVGEGATFYFSLDPEPAAK